MKLPIAGSSVAFQTSAEELRADAGLDCVVIGFNDLDFHERALRARATEKESAYYADIKLNSVLLGGRRLSYLDLLNRAMQEATGRPSALDTFRQPNLAVICLTSFLRKRGLAVEPVNSGRHDRDRLLELLSGSPRAVAVTTTFYVEPEPIVELVELVRAHSPTTKIVVGGPYVFRIASAYDSTTQDYLLSLIGADVYVADSQGEASLAALLYALRAGERADLSGVPNLIFTRDGTTFQRTRRIAEDNDLDENAVDWSLFDPAALRPTVYMRTARSCPFTCSFCSYPAAGGQHTTNQVDVVIAQLEQLRRLGVEQLVFVDDTLNVPLPRFKQLLRRMIDARIGLRWASFFRCSNADDETFALMAKSGCFGVFLGLESGDPGVLAHMDKHAKVERYRYGIERLHDQGIWTYASLIVGFPGETAASVDNTMEFLHRARPTLYFPNLYYHDVRAPIHARAAEFDLRGSGYSWQHASMDWREGVRHTKRLYEQVGGSLLCGGYSLSFWGIFYLLGAGLTPEQIRSYLTLARPMVLESYDEREATGFERLVEAFRA